MDRHQKIAYARSYTAELVAVHPEIVAVILGGSLARGDDLPISDIDLLYFIPGGAEDPSITRHPEGEVFIDIEVQPAEMLSDPESLRDPYWCGYLADALVLFDRDGIGVPCQSAAAETRARGVYRDEQLLGLRRTIERNLSELALAEGRVAQGAVAFPELCRTSIYALWTLIDWHLVRLGASPGGSRGLERLRGRAPDLAEHIVALECTDPLAFDVDAGLSALRAIMPRLSPFFQAWIDKVRWLFQHGYVPDGLHALWIALGLAIYYAQPGEGAVAQEAIDVACRHWLELVGWGGAALPQRCTALRRGVLEAANDDQPLCGRAR